MNKPADRTEDRRAGFVESFLDPPRGNKVFIGSLSPEKRRSMLEALVTSQAEQLERMRSVLEDRLTDQTSGDEDSRDVEESALARAAEEMDACLKMLGILSEIQTMQQTIVSKMKR